MKSPFVSTFCKMKFFLKKKGVLQRWGSSPWDSPHGLPLKAQLLGSWKNHKWHQKLIKYAEQSKSIHPMRCCWIIHQPLKGNESSLGLVCRGRPGIRWHTANSAFKHHERQHVKPLPNPQTGAKLGILSNYWQDTWKSIHEQMHVPKNTLF